MPLKTIEAGVSPECTLEVITIVGLRIQPYLLREIVIYHNGIPTTERHNSRL